MTEFKVGDEVEFTGFAYLYDGLKARGTHKVSKVSDDGYVSFAEDKRSSPWEINPLHLKIVAEKEGKETK